MTYNTNIPTGTVPLNLDYINIRNNFSALNTIFGVDHVVYTSTEVPAGYHTVLHLVPPSVDPSPVTGYGVFYNKLYNDGINTDTSLIFLTSLGKRIQLTRNVTPRANTNGYSFWPGPANNNGAILTQWGVVNSVSSGTVTFATSNIDFPNNCFNVTTQPFYNGSSAPGSRATVAIKINVDSMTMKPTGFSWTFLTDSSSWSGFYWTAIGN